tara:strand:- start:170 stop:1138 length:969 start_codon:yes stop_codon:yes gene_type:complete
MNEGLKIIFMGTPEFAQGILAQIIESNHEVLAVVTAPDRPAGRGQKLRQSAVKLYSASKNIDVLQPEKLRDEVFIETLKKYNADLFVVVAFRMLPEVVWAIPPKGTINLHGSLLPNYRGAAPINWAIINGEKRSGVTTFFINEKIDTGDIIKRSAVDISENMTAGELHNLLMVDGAELVLETLDQIESHNVEKEKQMDIQIDTIKHAPKIFKADCKIEWALEAQAIHNKIRGLSPYPGAWCKIEHKSKGSVVQFKLFSSMLTNKVPALGDKNLKTSEKGILFPCKDLFLLVDELQMEGKRRMNFKEFLSGNKIEDFALIEEQ